MQCPICHSNCSKAGKQSNGTQRYYCGSCNKYQQKAYRYLSYDHNVRMQFSKFSGMGCGVRKMASFLEISINTIQKWIGRAECLGPRFHFPVSGEYDIDEIQTYVGTRSKRVWITYGWHVTLKQAVGLQVGGRSSEDMDVVVREILALNPRRINTDNYSGYNKLMPRSIHRKGKRKANHIERQHRNMRKDIACLIRETMCYAKRPEMLEARIRWYLWGGSDPLFFLRTF